MSKKRKSGIDPQLQALTYDRNVWCVLLDNEKQLDELWEKDSNQILTITYDNSRIIKVSKRDKLLEKISDSFTGEQIMNGNRYVIDNPLEEKTIIFLSLSEAKRIYTTIEIEMLLN